MDPVRHLITDEGDHTRVECGFTATAGPDDGTLLAGILAERGQETGHTASIDGSQDG